MSTVITKVARPLLPTETLVSHSPLSSVNQNGLVLGNTMTFSLSPVRDEIITFGELPFFCFYDVTYQPAAAGSDRTTLDASADTAVAGLGMCQAGIGSLIKEFHVYLNDVLIGQSGDDGSYFFIDGVRYFFSQENCTEFPVIRTFEQASATGASAKFLKERLDCKSGTTSRERVLPFGLNTLPFRLRFCPSGQPGEAGDEHCLCITEEDNLRITLRFCDAPRTNERLFRSAATRAILYKEEALTDAQFPHASVQVRIRKVVLTARHRKGLSAKDRKVFTQKHRIAVSQPETRFHKIESSVSVAQFGFDITGEKVHELFFGFCLGYQLQFEEKRCCEMKFCVPMNLQKLEVKLSETEPAILCIDNLHDATLEDQSKRTYWYQINETFFRDHPLALSDVFAVKSTSETYGNIFYLRFDPRQLPTKFRIKMYFTKDKQPLLDLQCVLLLIKEKTLHIQPATKSVNGISTSRGVHIQ